MRRSPLGKFVLLSSCLLGLLFSGCITISKPAAFSKSEKKSNMKQVSYEETIPETPPDPENPEELKLAYAKWMEDINQVGEARKHYAAVAKKEPDNIDAILGLARLDQVAGQYAEAEQKYKRALRLSPESTAAKHGLGQFYASQERWHEALEPLTAAMLSEPDKIGYRYQLAVALVHSGDVESALPHFIRTVGDAEGHYNVGLILHEEGDLENAEKHFLLAVTKKPQLEQAQKWLAKLQTERSAGVAEAAGQPAPQEVPSQIIPVQHSTTQPKHSFATQPGMTTLKPLTSQQQEQLNNQQPTAGR
ncbi:tetratricopeptide repeat protein [Thalassoglobus sp.]|uniref:tetratricopeptide repeat protein n=1 Tax=Thalassoglobus sp. TaxID=2795869 RepID=UPI003AA99FA3